MECINNSRSPGDIFIISRGDLVILKSFSQTLIVLESLERRLKRVAINTKKLFFPCLWMIASISVGRKCFLLFSNKSITMLSLVVIDLSFCYGLEAAKQISANKESKVNDLWVIKLEALLVFFAEFCFFATWFCFFIIHLLL